MMHTPPPVLTKPNGSLSRSIAAPAAERLRGSTAQGAGAAGAGDTCCTATIPCQASRVGQRHEIITHI
jgi:hypothetical protein